MDWIKFPKVDLHRHLEGSLRLSTLEEIAAGPEYKAPPGEILRLREILELSEAERSPEAFLAKFPIIRGFFVSPEVIARLAYEAVADAAEDGLRYLEMRFNPAALAEARGLSLEQAADSVIAGVRRAEADFDIMLSLIITVNRAEALTAGKLLQLAADRLSEGLNGIDLAGDEVHIPADPYRDLFLEAKRQGLGITVHAGEWAGAENVRFAIENLEADRIGHGIRILEDTYTCELARERESVFEVCITSNLQTGAVSKLAEHPLPVMVKEKGLLATLNTDDPGLSEITLSGEMKIAHENLGFELLELKALTMLAADRAFLEEPEKTRLRARLSQDFRALGL
ncbi:adenosine deaminase [bacterium]|nr:adenosine deaminase [bacterium]